MKSLQYTPYTGPSGQDYYGLPMEEGVILIDLEIERKSHEEAFYGELGLNFTEDTRLLLGYRRSDVEYGDLVTRAIGTFDLWALWDQLEDTPFDSQQDVNNYKVSLEHSFNEDIFGYALATSGYRRGGINWPDPWAGTSMTSYDSDTLWNYELGLKTAWLDGRLVANVAAYMLDYDDIQLFMQEPVTYAYVTRNVGKAEIIGFEFGINYRATDNLTLGFGGSLSDSELKEDIPPFLNWDTGEFDVYTGRKGDKLPGSATESFSFTANYNRPLSDGIDLFASAFSRYVGSRLNDFNLDLDVELPSYSLTDLRVGLSFSNGWTVALFADNVFDEAIIYQIDRQGSAFESVPTNKPRTVGVNVIYNF